MYRPLGSGAEYRATGRPSTERQDSRVPSDRRTVRARRPAFRSGSSRQPPLNVAHQRTSVRRRASQPGATPTDPRPFRGTAGRCRLADSGPPIWLDKQSIAPPLWPAARCFRRAPSRWAGLRQSPAPMPVRTAPRDASSAQIKVRRPVPDTSAGCARPACGPAGQASERRRP